MGTLIDLAINYRVSEVSSVHAHIIARSFKAVLESIIRAPTQLVANISRSNASDISRVMHWNGVCPPLEQTCVHRLVSLQAIKSPSAMAVEAHDGSFTYEQLEHHAFRLARVLQSYGVGPEDLVPVYVEKSKWAVVALLGVLTAGGGYVPLDPKHPPSRIAEILELSSARTVIKSAALPEFVNEKGVRVVVVGGAILDPCEKVEIRDLAPNVSHENVFCVMFTSGSTGKPKGVVLQHSNIATSAIAHGTRIGFGPGTRSLQFATYTFDVSVMEIFTTLIFGGTVCIPSEGDRMEKLSTVMQELKVNWAFLTPTVAGIVQPWQVPSLQCLTLGGEAVSKSLVSTWSEKVDLSMVYAPSECTVLAQMHINVQPHTKPSSLGRPCGGLTWIVEAENHNQLAPVGVIGELVISGHIVGRGYLNDPERTAQSFIGRPAWAEYNLGFTGPGRFYKTGDLVRYDAEGNVHYIARKDTQIKLRGIRIELTDVEHHLLQTGVGTTLAVEIVQLPNSKHSTLAAFVSAGNDRTANEDQPQILKMTAGLKEKFGAAESRVQSILPSYMVPRLFVPMSQLPQTLSGKTDRQRLRLLASQLTDDVLADCQIASGIKRDPQTTHEIILQRMWADVLSLDIRSIGLDDSFLRMGGDSVNAMRLASRTREQGFALTVQAIFQHPRLDEMAAQMEEEIGVETDGIETPFVLIEKDTRELHIKEAARQCGVSRDEVVDVYPCTPFQEGLLALAVADPGSYVAHYQFSVPISVDVSRLKSAWEVTAMAHPVLRTRFVDIPHHGILQVVLKTSNMGLNQTTDWISTKKHIESSTMRLGQENSKLTLLETQKRKDSRIFVWSIFHAIIDGWSIKLVLEDVMSAYQHGHLGPRKNQIEFRDFVHHVIKLDVMTAETYWSKYLAESAETDFPRNLSRHSDHRKALPTTFLKARIALGTHSNNITLANIIKGAWGLVIAHHSNSSAVCFGLTITGRNAPISSVENLVGPTVTTVPIRIDVDKNVTAASYLSQIQDDATKMIPFEQFGLLRIQHLSPEAKAACAFQSLLVIHPKEDHVVSTADGHMHVLMIDSQMRQSFPLTFQVWLGASDITIEASYDKCILSKDMLHTVVGHFERAVAQLIDTSFPEESAIQRTLGDISLLNVQDRSLIESWNRLTPIAQTDMLSLVEHQCNVSAPQTAVDAWDGSFTFEDLETLSTNLALELKDYGVGDEVLVPMLYEKSRWFVVAALAVWKAGGCYTPLDASQPIERLREVTLMTSPAIILASKTHAAVASELATMTGVMSAVLHGERLTQTTGSKNQKSSFPATRFQSRAAVCIFTSGSTGRPKGVLLEHYALGLTIAALGKSLVLSPKSRMLQFSSYTWDAHLAEVWATITYGGTLCIPSANDRLDNLQAYMKISAVNTAVLTPTVSALLNPNLLPSLVTLLLVGETASRKEVARWTGLAGGLMNGYGPTEGCVCVTVNSSMIAESPEDIGSSLVGHTWIVEPGNCDELTPIGCIGELLVSGPSIARGYLNDPERTAEVFRENLDWMSELHSGRLNVKRVYKTGDLARYRGDGSLQYLGRKDAQMKLRGLRIEPGEVEHHASNALLFQPISGDSEHSDYIVVADVVQPRAQASPALALFIRTDIESRSPIFRQLIAVLNNHLLKTVPSHMVPKLFIPVLDFPETRSNKIDRKRLQEMSSDFTEEDLASFGVSDDAIDSRNPESIMERALSSLWTDILKLPMDKNPVVGDNFLRLGGDSVTTMRLVAAARSQGILLTASNVFENPTLAGMAAVATMAMGLNQNELPLFSLVKGVVPVDLSMEVAAKCNVPSQQVQDVYPCTPLQEGLMALSIQSPGSYFTRLVFPLPRDIDVVRFQSAWDAAVDSTEILRTRIVALQDSRLVQVVLKDSIRWTFAQDLASHLERDEMNIIQLGQPLVRLAIVGSLPEACHFVWTIHHAAYDASSTPMIIDRVEQGYANHAVAKSIPYNAFINYLVGLDTTLAKEYWCAQLDGSIPSKFPELPSTIYQAHADSTLTHRVLVSRKEGSSTALSTTIRAAWAFLISKYVGTDDVVFGSTLSGRNAPVEGIASICGPTITTVPVRVQVGAEKSVEDVLFQVQEQAASMIPFEHTGLQNIKRFSKDAEAACDFQNLLIIQPEARMDSGSNKRLLEEDASSVGAMSTLTYALTIVCTLTKIGVDVAAYYDQSLIDAAQTKRILIQFERMLQTFAQERSGMLLGELETISRTEKEDLMSRNGKSFEIIHSCVHHILERQMALRPKAPAIDSWDGHFTYGMLNDLSSKLAQYLRYHGTGPESLVPLCFEKSAWAIVAMLGVLKAGGAFVPLDPSHPVSRLRSMMGQLGSRVILASPRNEDLCKAFDVKVVVIGTDILNSLPMFDDTETAHVRPHNSAYVIFTSGSTGNPKGAIIEHQAISTGSTAHGKVLGLDSTTRFLQFSSYTFDLCITEIITTLVFGGCICVPSDAERLGNLVEFMNEKEVNTAYLTPSVISMYHPNDLPMLRTLIGGGESMRKDLVQAWAHRVRLFNAYGPTECCVFCTCTEVPRGGRAENIGTAVGCNTWICDANDATKLAPIGGIGELLIEGPIIFRGYIGDTAKTDAATLLNPPSLPRHGLENRRLYKTGDLVRYSSDGSIDYVGRKDNQVKLRGQRLELAEIEYHLFNSSLFKALMVLLPKSGPLCGRLLAIISISDPSNLGGANEELKIIPQVPGAEVARKISDVRSYVSEQLPDYMIPSTWIVVESIPYMTSGKMNRGKVNEWLESVDEKTYHKIMEIGMEKLSNERVTPMETTLRYICSQVLNVPEAEILLPRSFLSLGGDSISSMQLVSRCRSEGISITVPDVMRAKSISTLATTAKSALRSSSSYEEQTGLLFQLLPIQKLHFRMHPEGQNHFNQSFLLRLKNPISPDKIASAIKTIVEYHSMLRCRLVRRKNGQWNQLVGADIASSYRFNTHGLLPSSTASSIINTSQTSLDIEDGPLLAVDNFYMEDGGQFLSLLAHHLVIDLVSWRIILHDLEEILKGKNLSLPKPLPFQNWVQMQAEYVFRQEKHETTLPFVVPKANPSYWDMGNRTNTYSDALTISLALSVDETTQLLGGANKALRTSPVDIFQSAALLSFARTFDDRQPPALHVESHGREPWDPEIDLSRTVGWFTTLHPVHVPLTSETDILEAVRKAKEVRLQIPQNGWWYFSNMFASHDDNKTPVMDEPMEMVFNYLGQYQQLERNDSLLRQVPWGTIQSSDMGPDAVRMGLFEISVAVENAALRLYLVYNRHMNHQDKIIQWLDHYKQTLQEATVQLLTAKVEFRESDFPLMAWKNDGMDHFLHKTLPGLELPNEAEVENIYQCSAIQEHILLSQLQSLGYYNFHLVWEVSCSRAIIDPQLLIRSWKRVVAHHPVLRTIFVQSHSVVGLFDQVVFKNVVNEPLLITSKDEDALEKLGQQPPIAHRIGSFTNRFTVIATDSGKVFVKLELSHAITDATTTALLRDELALEYEGLRMKKSHSEFSDYIEFVNSQPLKPSLAYWKSYLGTAQRCLLPVDSGKPVSATTHRTMKVDLGGTGQISSFCASNGMTVSNFFKLAWSCVLRKLTGNDSVCFGYLASVRDSAAADLQNVAAPLFNLLVCMVELNGSRQMSAVLRQIHADFIDAISYRDASLSAITKSLDLGDGPLFNTLLNSRKSIASLGRESSAISFRTVAGQDPMDVSTPTSIETSLISLQFDIVVVIEDTDGEIEVNIDYWQTRISDTRMAEIAKYLRTSCVWILRSLEKTIDSFDGL